MKKSICFAGFADSELPALRAAVATGNSLWECCFVADAPATLALLAEQPLDALVADMSMSGKSGAELLRDVREKFPNTLGFIVGNVTDQELIINCIGGTHQFIRRPFQPAKLVATLQRGLKLDAWLSNDELRKLAPRLRRMPSLPSTYFNLIKEIESDSVTTQNIGAVIARDPVVTARLLQMVNSAAFALVQKVTDPIDAVAVLGIETIKSLVLCLQVFTQSDEARAAGLSLEILWEHSLLVAKFARQITLKQTGDARLASDAFTAGLLHDVGRIVIASNLPKEYAAVVASAREKSHPLHEEETAQLGVNHAQVGAYLLGLWGLPATLVEATAGHHAPGDTAFAREFSLLGAVHAANVFAHSSGCQTDGLPLPELDLAYFTTLHLDDQLPVWREVCTGEKAPAPPAKKTSNIPPPPPAYLLPPVMPLARPENHFARALIAVTVLFFLVGGFAAWRFFSKSTLPPIAEAATNTVVIAPPVVTASAPPLPPPTVEKPVVAAPVVATPPPNPFANVRVQGIFYRTASPLAIINNRTVGVGDQFNGIQVVGIDQHSVTLVQNGERKVFKFN
jgi:HD-like signal output (HDOD) protein